MNLGQQIGQQISAQHFGGQQVGGQTINPMFHTDRTPHRHVEAYQQVPDPQPPHRQDADAYWADKSLGFRVWDKTQTQHLLLSDTVSSRI